MSNREAFLDAVSGEVNEAMEEWDLGNIGTHGPSMAGHVVARLEKTGALRVDIGCDREENVPLDGVEFTPACKACGETLIHDYYWGDLVYRHSGATK